MTKNDTISRHQISSLFLLSAFFVEKKNELWNLGTCMHLLWGTLLKFQDWNILGVISWESKGPTPPPPIATLFGGNRRPGG